MRYSALAALVSLLLVSPHPTDAQPSELLSWQYRNVAGHDPAVRMELGDDDRTLIVASERGFRHWDIAERRLVSSVREDARPPLYLHDLSPDGRTIAHTREWAGAELTLQALGRPPSVTGSIGPGRFRFTIDGRYGVHVSDSSLQLLRTPGLDVVWKRMEESPGLFLESSRDNSMLLFTRDGALMIRRFSDGELLRVLDGFLVTQAFFGLGGRRVVAHNSMDMAIWDAATGELRQWFHDGSSRLVMRPGGRYAITMETGGPAGDSTVRVWDIEREARIRDYAMRGLHYPLYGAVLTPDERRLIIAEGDGGLAVVDVMNGTIVDRMFGSGEQGSIGGLAVSLDGRLVATGSMRLNIRRAADGEVLRSLGRLGIHVTGLAFSPDADRLAVTTRTALTIHSVETGDTILWMKQVNARDVAWSSDGARIAVATNAGVRLYDPATWEPVRELPSERGSCNSVAFSPDGHWLAAGTVDGAVIVWSAATGAFRSSTSRHTDEVLSVIFTADSRGVVSGGRDQSIIVDDLDGTFREFPRVERGPIHSLAISKNGRYLHVGAREENTFDLATGELLIHYGESSGHAEGARYVAAIPETGALLVGTADGDLLAWRAFGSMRVEEGPVSTSVAVERSGEQIIVTPGLEAARAVSVRLHSITGRLLRTTSEQALHPGERMSLDVGGLPSGSYVLRVEVGDEATTRMIRITR